LLGTFVNIRLQMVWYFNGSSVGARHELVLLVASSFETKARIERDADGYFRAILGDREPKLHDAPPS